MSKQQDITTFCRAAADKLEELGAQGETVTFPNFDFSPTARQEELPHYHNIRLACEAIRGDVTPHGEGCHQIPADTLAALVRYIGDMLEE